MADFATHRSRVVARKMHICDNCLGGINRGEPYLTLFQVVEGRPAQWKEHVACHKASEIVASHMNSMYLANSELPFVCDMDQEDRAIVRHECPQTYSAIWGGARSFRCAGVEQ